MKLLSKGPNFAITQDITKKILVEVEKSLERLAYGKRWKDEIVRQELSNRLQPVLSLRHRQFQSVSTMLCQLQLVPISRRQLHLVPSGRRQLQLVPS